ncbi:hypothetical protein IF1G_00358 [Cordyceps javanica]|uniref:Uncharacterized protein n=1 Tax=Cordyceps javanica TaxID=43265 RepID=A0A545VFD4_9HYPO|nr:hypothetical protein IF1G_00358 [Cordyceps javanica]
MRRSALAGLKKIPRAPVDALTRATQIRARTGKWILPGCPLRHKPHSALATDLPPITCSSIPDRKCGACFFFFCQHCARLGWLGFCEPETGVKLTVAHTTHIRPSLSFAAQHTSQYSRLTTVPQGPHHTAYFPYFHNFTGLLLK